jgi:hypothetical protein
MGEFIGATAELDEAILADPNDADEFEIRDPAEHWYRSQLTLLDRGYDSARQPV